MQKSVQDPEDLGEERSSRFGIEAWDGCLSAQWVRANHCLVPSLPITSRWADANMLLGFVTAIIAYLVIRLESHLFDLKSGLCLSEPFDLRTAHTCSQWRDWYKVRWPILEWMRSVFPVGHVEAGIYFAVAVSQLGPV